MTSDQMVQLEIKLSKNKEILKDLLGDATIGGITKDTKVKIEKYKYQGVSLKLSNGLRIFTINIYELTNKVKKKALLLGYELYPAIIDVNEATCEVYGKDMTETVFTETTEPLVIITAYIWIYEKNKTK